MFDIDEELGKIVLGCERADRVRLAPVVEQLSALGYTIELASGLDIAERPLIDALERLGPHAVYLLLGGARSPRPVVERWRRAVYDAGVPAEQIWMGDARFIGPSDLMRNAFEMAEELRCEVRTVETKIVRKIPRPSTRPDLEPPEPDPSRHRALLPRTDGFDRWRVPIAVGLSLAGLLLSGSLAFAWWDSSGSHSSASVAEEEMSSEPPTVAAIETRDSQVEPRDEASNEIEPDERPHPSQSEVAAIDRIDQIDRALARREFRALDVLLVAPVAREGDGEAEHATMTDFAAARAYCRQLDIEGVSRWTLPSVGELRSLSRGGMLNRGTYWSRTSGDVHGDWRMVWNERRKRWKAVGPRWHYGNTVCVRRRVPSAAANG